MKQPVSFLACLIVCVSLLCFRGFHSGSGEGRKQLMITQWDAFGYYLYLPAHFIYHDYAKLDWATGVDAVYNVTGGDGLPVQALDNGNKVCKYLCGVAILQSPFFALAHMLAAASGLPADGFSPVYQYALAFGVILYCVLALLLLRRILLRYFRDAIVAVTLMLLCLATNFLQYAAVDSGLSHAWIFPLYVLLLFATIKWHESPRAGWAWLTGYIIGLATICRPTEAIALFIPLLWGLQSKEAARAKWRAVTAHRLHVAYAMLGGILGILPQLLYWESVTGSFIYDVGSKWVFFDPWFRVLLGWEKGWFIYTPVTILFVLGLAMIRKYDFGMALLVFCLLNIWIVIAWDDWRYGASYSARALVQSYALFAFPLAAVVDRLHRKGWRIAVYVSAAYLIGLNLFQTVQYNSTILHYNDMNRRYYSRIYLNPDPSPLDMSLLDTEEWISDENRYSRKQIILQTQPLRLQAAANADIILLDTPLREDPAAPERWLKIQVALSAPDHLWRSMLVAELAAGDSSKRLAIRLDNPVGKKREEYACYLRIPAPCQDCRIRISISSPFDFDGLVRRLEVTRLSRSSSDRH